MPSYFSPSSDDFSCVKSKASFAMSADVANTTRLTVSEMTQMIHTVKCCRKMSVLLKRSSANRTSGAELAVV